MRLDYSKKFIKQFRKAPIKIQKQWYKKLAIFTQEDNYSIVKFYAMGIHSQLYG